MDMAGDVWEWTTTLWGKKVQVSDISYPYQEVQDRENLQSKGFRVVVSIAFKKTGKPCDPRIKGGVKSQRGLFSVAYFRPNIEIAHAPY